MKSMMFQTVDRDSLFTELDFRSKQPALQAERRESDDPAALEAWAGAELDDGINILLEAPTLARSARFLVLAVDQLRQSVVKSGEIYAGWRWLK